MLARVRFIRPYLLWRTGETAEMMEDWAIRLSLEGPHGAPVLEFADGKPDSVPATIVLRQEPPEEPVEIQLTEEEIPQVEAPAELVLGPVTIVPIRKRK
jgi:hypothetical protein